MEACCNNCKNLAKTNFMGNRGVCTEHNQSISLIYTTNCSSFKDKRENEPEQIIRNIANTDTAIIYGPVTGNIINCETVVIINGDVKGRIINCNTVAGLLSDRVPSRMDR